ncbi:keratin-associated protein 13-1-like [Suncus etruscus]|uniref:keratin-associated protein 13-1-like n=1 Tax=Suncus etruscus TaxID=109475 RepID=UPI0021107FF4|nr:keratin-associated protein 13-1-like [Suncus etruscus]
MSYSCCSGNYSSSSFGGCLQYPGSPCGGSSYSSNLGYGSGFGSPSACQMGSSFYNSSQEICTKPIRVQSSCGVPVSCQSSCFRSKPSTFCSPCRPTHPSCGSSGSYSLGYGHGSSYSLGCGSTGFKPQACGGTGFPSVSSGSGFSRPSYLISKPTHPSCYRPSCGSGF